VVNQPLVCTFSTDTTITDAFRFVVQVFEDGTEIGKYYLAPNANDVAHIDLSELLRNRVEADDANHLNTAVIHANDTNFLARSTTGIHEIQVRVGEWNGTSETLNDDNATFLIVGGAEQKSSGFNPDFSNYYATGLTRTGWLTDYAAGTYIEMKGRDEDEGRMAFIAKNTYSDATALNYTITTTTSTTAVYVPISATYGGLVPSTTTLAGYLQYVGLMPATIDGLTGLDAPGGTSETIDLTDWISYTIQLVDGVTPKSKPIRVTRDCSSQNHTQVAWTNSRGGWDYFNFNGKRLDTTTTDSKPYKAALGDWDAATYGFKSWNRESKYYHKTATQMYQLNTICTEEEMAVIRSLLLSRKAMIRLGNWLPVLIVESSLQIRESGHKMYVVTFQVELAQEVLC
jgi:hypothetical protein